MTVTEPGIYDLDEADYHADRKLAPTLGRSLSVSGAKTLLVNPARFAWERANGRKNRKVFDLGTVAHALILGNPDKRIQIIDAYDWRTKAAKGAKQEAYDAGQVPIHRGDLRAIAPLRRAVRRHPLASQILTHGKAEQSIYWVDEPTGITCRGRIDYARDDALIDVKTVSAGGTDPHELERAAAKFDWPMQAANYTDGWQAITGILVPFLFVAIEKEPPHFIRIVQLDDEALDQGRQRMARARELFAQYERDGYPTAGAEIDTLTMPRWYNNDL